MIKSNIIRTGFGFLFICFALSAGASDYIDFDADDVHSIMLVVPAKYTVSVLDPAGFYDFKKQYKTRKETVYVMRGENELHRVNDTVILEHISKLELADNYYVFDAKVFKENSEVHPHGWGTLLVVGSGARCLIFDITSPVQRPRLFAEISLPPASGTCSANPTALTLENPFGRYPNWYLAFGSGKGAHVPEIYLFNLQTRRLDDETVIRASRYKQVSSVGGISAADIDQDGITDILYFGTSEERNGELGGSLYSLRFTKSLAHRNNNSHKGKASRLLRPVLRKIFQAKGELTYKPLLKKDTEGTAWIFFSTQTRVYGLMENFSGRSVSPLYLNERSPERSGWYRTLANKEVFTSGVRDFGDMIALSTLRTDCRECSDEDKNDIKLYRAFNGDEVTELSSKETLLVNRGERLQGWDDTPFKRTGTSLQHPHAVSRLAAEVSATYGEEDSLVGRDVAPGIRRLSWWQQ